MLHRVLHQNGNVSGGKLVDNIRVDFSNRLENLFHTRKVGGMETVWAGSDRISMRGFDFKARRKKQMKGKGTENNSNPFWLSKLKWRESFNWVVGSPFRLLPRRWIWEFSAVLLRFLVKWTSQFLIGKQSQTIISITLVAIHRFTKLSFFSFRHRESRMQVKSMSSHWWWNSWRCIVSPPQWLATKFSNYSSSQPQRIARLIDLNVALRVDYLIVCEWKCLWLEDWAHIWLKTQKGIWFKLENN